jgi:transposase
MTLSYSRALYLEFFFDQTTENFLRGHVHAFQAWAGQPRVILYDNLKSAVLERRGSQILFNPRLIELSAHYHFAPRPCQVRAGNQQGRVERAIRYVRDSFGPAATSPRWPNATGRRGCGGIRLRIADAGPNRTVARSRKHSPKSSRVC